MNFVFKKIGLLLASSAFIATPVATIISCNDNKSQIDVTRSIVYYYDGSNNKAGIKESMVKVQKWYNDDMEKAFKDGKIKNKIKLVIKEGESAYFAKNNMTKIWGYNDSKSPDVWFGGQADTATYRSRSGNYIIHGFEENEYNEFWNAAGFQDPTKSLDRKSQKTIIKNKKVRTTIPWFGKGFFNIEYSENKDSTYDTTKNEKYRSGEIKLGSSTMPMESTLIGMNNSWNHNPFTNAILEYLRGPLDEDGKPTTDLAKYKRNNADGFSNTIADTGFINKNGNNVGSILFAKKGEEANWDYTNINKLDLGKPSEHAVAWHQFIQSDMTGQKINGINYDSLSTKFRATKNLQNIAKKIDIRTVLGFMGVSKDDKNNYQDTPKDKHQFKNLLGAGIDWVKFMEETIKEGKLTKGNKPNKAKIEEMLSHYHVYRMPKIWQMDTADTNNFPLYGPKGGTPRLVKKLDGQNIYGVNDGKVTEAAITPMQDGDFLTFNQRTWEIKDKQLREDKIEALKIFVGALYNTKNDKEYAKLLLQSRGTFSSNQRLRELGMPKKNAKGVWNSQKDRLWSETAKALGYIESAEQQNAKVGSDWSGWTDAYWGGAWKLEDNSSYTPYQNAAFLAKKYKSTIDKQTASLKRRYPNDNKHFLGA